MNHSIDDLLGHNLQQVDEFIDLSNDTANFILDVLKAKGMSQRDFAKKLGKRESEVRKWLSGTYNFDYRMLAQISAVLGIKLIHIPIMNPQNQAGIADS